MIRAIGTAPLHWSRSQEEKKERLETENYTQSQNFRKEGKIQDLLLSLLLVWNDGNGGFEIAQLLHQE